MDACAADMPYLRRDHTGSSGPASRLLRSYRLADAVYVLDARMDLRTWTTFCRCFVSCISIVTSTKPFPPSVEDLDSRMFVLRFEIADVISARIPCRSSTEIASLTENSSSPGR